jgi:hypothetical protein
MMSVAKLYTGSSLKKSSFSNISLFSLLSPKVKQKSTHRLTISSTPKSSSVRKDNDLSSLKLRIGTAKHPPVHRSLGEGVSHFFSCLFGQVFSLSKEATAHCTRVGFGWVVVDSLKRGLNIGFLSYIGVIGVCL